MALLAAGARCNTEAMSSPAGFRSSSARHNTSGEYSKSRVKLEALSYSLETWLLDMTLDFGFLFETVPNYLKKSDSILAFFFCCCFCGVRLGVILFWHFIFWLYFSDINNLIMYEKNSHLYFLPYWLYVLISNSSPAAERPALCRVRLTLHPYNPHLSVFN